ncbi:MAG: TraR/DksA C4-type zinc finger protein [Bdellovibrionales bacterium]|nr:TraR/DksA C4-type zinc finger protein [Bdellovibrionales bacterium]
MESLSKEVIERCKATLLETKSEILNRVANAKKELYTGDDKGGDEGDQTMRALAETEFLSMNERLRKQLMEIEMALGRIESGTYGICEETEEVIETDRLLAIPWTRLSIEGAEIRESVSRRYAR